MKTKIKKIFSSSRRCVRKYLPRYYDPSRQYRSYYDRNYDKAKIKKNTILYEVRDGQSMTDSPLYLFLNIIKNEKYKNFRHIWVIRDDVDVELFFINIPNRYRYKVELVYRNTVEYAQWLLEAEYLINNSTFQNFFHKHKNQKYINTWHGTPLKFMGYDIPGSKTSLKNVQRNFLMSDYIISPNRYTTDLFLNRYKLDGLYEGIILETGYPRNDILKYRDKDILKNLIDMGININEKPIILYTPTWKGTSVNNPSGNIKQILAEVNVLQSVNLDKQILVKVHPYVYQQALNEPDLSSILIPDVIDANRVLSIVDILVTDYSSIFFDFLVTNKPIVFYAWDKEQYEIYRGMYLSEDELPAPVLTSIYEVADYIANNPVTSNKKYQSIKEKMTSLEDGKVSKRVVDRIFNNDSLRKGKEIHLNNKKQKLLIFTGGMLNNGITTSLQNLTKNFDYNKYDVSVITWDSNAIEKVKNINLLDDHIRIIYRFGWSSFTFMESFADKFIQHFGIQSWNKWMLPVKGYKRDIHRLIGDIKFDAAVDFSGYSYNGSRIIAFSDVPIKSVFQHNDLWSDANKVIRGKQPNKRGLLTLFSLYYKYNHVVSVSEKLANINEKKLKIYLKPNQQTFAKNTLNLNHKFTNIKKSDITIETINEIVLLKAAYVNIYNDLKKYYNNESAVYYFNENDELSGVTKIIFNDGVELIKLVKNNLPYAWVKMDDITFSNKILITEESKFNKVIWIKNNKSNVYASLDQFEIITRGWLLNNSFSLADKIIKTNKGEYIRFNIPGSERYGYINKSSTKLLKSNNLTIIQKIWNIRKHGEDRFDLTPKLIRYKGKDNEIVFWNEPPKVSSKSKIIDNNFKFINNSFHLVDATSIYKNNEFLRVIDKDNNFFGISSKNIEILDLRKIVNEIDSSNNNSPFWISSKNIEILDLHKIVDEIGINQETLLLNDQTDDGRKIVRDHFGNLDENNNIIILSVVDDLKNIESILLFNVTKNSFNWVNKVLTNKICNSSLEIIDDLTKQDAEKYIFEIQSKFKVNTDELDQIKALDIKPIDNNDILNKRMLEDSEMNLLKDTLINIFDKINGNMLQKNVLILNFIKIDKLLIKGGEIWFNGYCADGKSYIFQIDNELFEEKNIKVSAGVNLELEPDQFVNKLNYMAMGRLSPEKNQISLLIAFKKVLQYKTNAYLWILGDGKMRKELETLANILHIKNNVIFWGFRNNPQDFLKKSDVFVHPSYYEGQPMVLLEALNQNALVVASNIAANVSVLGNQKYGLIMEGITPKDIQEGMLKIVDNLFDFDIFDENKYNKKAIDWFMTVVTNK